eukprot:6799669-Heterocapsa_arctica.AAC.1
MVRRRRWCGLRPAGAWVHPLVYISWEIHLAANKFASADGGLFQGRLRPRGSAVGVLFQGRLHLLGRR